MAHLLERLGRGQKLWKGLSDRSRPDALTAAECCALRNVDWFEDGVVRRNGYQRKAGPFRTGSIRLDGVAGMLRIANKAAFQPSTVNFYLGCAVILRQRPVAGTPRTIWSWGFGGGVNHYADLRYDSTAGTGALGAWVLRLRDASGAVTRTATLDDGDGVVAPVGSYRFIEAWNDGTNVTLKRWDEFGNATTTTTTAAAGLNWNVNQDFWVGVGTTALNTPDVDFASVTIAELRYAIPATAPATAGITATTTNKYYIRELDAAGRALCAGYWRLDDGDNSGKCLAAVGGQHATIVNTPPPWVLYSASPNILGQAAVRFVPGSNAWLDLRDNTSGTTMVSSLFGPGGAALSTGITLEGIHVPELPPGATTVPDQVVFWSGTSVAAPPLPSPLGLRVVGDRYEARFNDNGVNRSVTMTGAVSGGTAPTVTSLVGKRVRWRVLVAPPVAPYLGIGLTLQLVIDNGASAAPSVFTKSDGNTPNAAGPSVISQDWAFGKHVTNFATARLGATNAFHTDGSLVGILDDVRWWPQYAIYPVPGGANLWGINPFQEQGTLNGFPAVLNMRLNEGAGTGPLEVLTTNSGAWEAFLRPVTGVGTAWDVGLVDPQTPRRCALVKAYDRFTSDRSTANMRRDVLVACGTTLYAYDIVENRVRILGALPAKADACTFAQYGQRGLLAGAPGVRPVWTDGAGVYQLGIEAPQAQATVVVYNGAGTFPNGTFRLYVTYHNRGEPFTRSNPGPGVAVTFAGANDTIDSVQLPVSTDPQVNQRKIWMTLSGGAHGSPLYLVATVDDNTTVNYTTDIASVSAAAESITDYLDHDAAPFGTVIRQFKDYTLLGGEQLKPTRLYFSQAQTPDYWFLDDGAGGGDFLDLDLDTGRAITAIMPLLDRALVEFSDGRAVVVLTGDDADPLTFNFANRSSGSVGSQAIWARSNAAYFIGEDALYATTGYDDQNLSGPGEKTYDAPRYLQETERPSISRTVLRKLVGANRRRFVAVANPRKSQLWFAVSTTDPYDADHGHTNDAVLVYDTERRIWSRWDVPLDCADLVDDAAGNAGVWGAVDGYLCQLDAEDQLVDGWYGSIPAGIVQSVAGQTITVTTTPFGTAGQQRFLRCWLYRQSDGALLNFQLRDNPSTSQVTAQDGVDLTGVTAGDVLLVGGIPHWAEFCWRLGAATDPKIWSWLRLYGECTADPTYLRVAYKLDENRYDQTLSGWTNEIRQWPVGTSHLEINLGGKSGLLRVRIGESALAVTPTAEFVPGVGKIKISALDVMAQPVRDLTSG